MRSVWMEVSLGETINLKRGYDLPSAQRRKGMYPIYSSSGLTDYHNEYKVSGEGVITGRYGTIGEVFFSKDSFWPLNTTLYVEDFKGNYPKFIYYLLKTVNFSIFTDKSAVPGINRNHVHLYKVKIPPLSEQHAIAAILSCLDDKIANNTKINHHLEQMTQAIWTERFGSRESNGVLGDIIELFDSKRVPLSGNQRANMEKIYPYYGAASLMDYVDDYLFDGIYLLLGEDGTVVDNLGFPILQYVWGKFWVNNHAHILHGRNGFTVESLYTLLKQTSVASIVTGAVQPKINQANLKALDVIIPSMSEMDAFNALITPLFAQIRNNSDENLILAELRDTLLPRLMSGVLSIDTESKAQYNDSI